MMEAARRANVMFVDDEPRVLTSMRALFRRDYNVHLANSGDQALALLDQADMDVIVSDQRMPGMTGVDVLKACKERAPRAMRILLTGYADKDAITASINDGEVFRYLTKPCARETLRETVALAVSAAGIAPPAASPDATPQAEGAAVESGSPGAGAAAPRPAAAEAAAPAGSAAAAAAGPVDLVVLSSDPGFTGALEQALDGRHRLHVVTDVKEAVPVLEAHAVGVLITDIAVHGDEIQALTAELKHYVPELVTIVASDHSDAHRLIDLINGGQVFRFLLKPIKPKQTAIWIDSAVSKHLDLIRNPDLVARHAVSPPSSLRRLGEGLVKSMTDRFLRLRDRGALGASGGSRT